MKGALGYAWFWGAAGSEVLGAITSINSLVITAAAAGTQTATSLGASDNSVNALAFDGLISQAVKTGSGAYIAIQPTGTAGAGTPLTADGAGGIVEIDAALKSLWDNYRLSPDYDLGVVAGSAQHLEENPHRLGGRGATLRLRGEPERDRRRIMVRTYLNRFSMQGGSSLDIKLHPNLPAGTVLLTTQALPYPLSGVGNVMQIRTRQDYYQIEWPLRSRKYEYGVYADEVLQHYFPPSLAVISNIGNG